MVVIFRGKHAGSASIRCCSKGHKYMHMKGRFEQGSSKQTTTAIALRFQCRIIEFLPAAYCSLLLYKMPEMGHSASKDICNLSSSSAPANEKNADVNNTSLFKPDGVTTGCPFADLSIAISPLDSERGCPFSFHSHRQFDETSVTIKDSVPLAVSLMGTHRVSEGSAALLADIGGGDRIREVCTRFYARMHEDSHLKQFLFLDDGPVHHGKRLADWIVEKMGGEGKPWTDSGRFGMRQPSHHAAWNSARRHPSGNCHCLHA